MTLYDAEPRCPKCRKRTQVWFTSDRPVSTGELGDKFTYECPECRQTIMQAFDAYGEHGNSEPPDGATIAFKGI